MERMKHFVLVHGSGHGAWCWYKLATLLKLAGHRVTTLDMVASGVNPKLLDEVRSISDYVQPLMEFMASLPQEEKVILVGHSYGGIRISLAMESFPEKISVAIFPTAIMPIITSPPGTVVQEWLIRRPQELSVGQDIFPPTSVVLDPNFMETKMYQCCQSEDLTLATMLVRPAGFFVEELLKETLLSKEKYGSISRVYIVCDEDELLKGDFQRWMIDNSHPTEVKVIIGADHMVMLSKPQELSSCLEEIAEKYGG